MANKKPKNETSNYDEMKQQEKAAVNVDSNNTPKKAKKTVKKNSDKPNIFKRMWKGIKGIFSELKKVTWTKGKEVGSNTAVVLGGVVLSSSTTCFRAYSVLLQTISGRQYSFKEALWKI